MVNVELSELKQAARRGGQGGTGREVLGFEFMTDR
jgi:hypothetical protein